MLSKKRKIPRRNLGLARVTAVRAHAHGTRSVDIARMLGVHHVTVSRWISKYRQAGAIGLRVKKSSGRPRKVDCGVFSRKLFKIVRRPATRYGFENPLWNTSRLRMVIKKDLGVDFSVSTIWRELKRVGLSNQKPENVAFEASDEERNKWQKKTWPKIRRLAKKQRAVILFEDEATVRLTPNLGKTWAIKSQTPKIKVTGKRASIGVISAISATGKLLFKIPSKRVDSRVFIEFLNQVLREIPRKKIIMILDNGSSHKSALTRDFVEQHSRLKLFFLPPYSPDFNPDELTWARLKNYELLSHSETTKEGLKRKTRNKMKSMQKKPKIVRSFYKKVY